MINSNTTTGENNMSDENNNTSTAEDNSSTESQESSSTNVSEEDGAVWDTSDKKEVAAAKGESGSESDSESESESSSESESESETESDKKDGDESEAESADIHTMPIEKIKELIREKKLSPEQMEAGSVQLASAEMERDEAQSREKLLMEALIDPSTVLTSDQMDELSAAYDTEDKEEAKKLRMEMVSKAVDEKLKSKEYHDNSAYIQNQREYASFITSKGDEIDAKKFAECFKKTITVAEQEAFDKGDVKLNALLEKTWKVYSGGDKTKTRVYKGPTPPRQIKGASSKRAPYDGEAKW